ncbi:MAG: DegV family protein [Cellulomonas sp.]|nr:DegV family protein [Cellulomonas sp.]MCR6690421.1 DegV family protein [Cellulomonas sp.]
MGRRGRPADAPASVAVVTDSTASLPPDVARRWGVGVVPLDVLVGAQRHVEGVDLTSAGLLAALQSGARVSTSQPPPAAFAAAYTAAAEAGAREVVSIHLSGELSGTVQAARLAAREAPVPVHVVDARTTVMALGWTVLEAARFARDVTVPALLEGPPVPPEPQPLGFGRRIGRLLAPPEPVAPLPDGAAVAAHAGAGARGTRAWFLVDSLDHLRRGGRLSAPAAALGTVLGLRPLLTLGDGRVVVAEKVRTRRAARERLEQAARTHAAGLARTRVTVHHLGQADLAAELLTHVRTWPGVIESVAAETSAVVAAHVGPGLLAIVVAEA